MSINDTRTGTNECIWYLMSSELTELLEYTHDNHNMRALQDRFATRKRGPRGISWPARCVDSFYYSMNYLYLNSKGASWSCDNRSIARSASPKALCVRFVIWHVTQNHGKLLIEQAWASPMQSQGWHKSCKDNVPRVQGISENVTGTGTAG